VTNEFECCVLGHSWEAFVSDSNLKTSSLNMAPKRIEKEPRRDLFSIEKFAARNMLTK
jgi:hypothetical protein